jgi:catechol 2,3-dioxygenase-like lactoylglutathione lyase family enzyme
VLGPGLVLFVFLEVSRIEEQRRLFEDVLGLPVVENRFHPPHSHHGLVKYDAGTTLLALNLNRNAAFLRGGDDGLVIELLDGGRAWDPPPGLVTSCDPGGLVDLDGHRIARMPSGLAFGDGRASVAGLELTVTDLERSAAFYRDRLGLVVTRTGPATAEVATATVPMRLRTGTPPARRNGFLIVFHTWDVVACCGRLRATGVCFPHGPGFSEIGGTARFADPDGHVFCLYEPSAEALGWESGPTVTRLVESFSTQVGARS